MLFFPVEMGVVLTIFPMDMGMSVNMYMLMGMGISPMGMFVAVNMSMFMRMLQLNRVPNHKPCADKHNR